MTGKLMAERPMPKPRTPDPALPNEAGKLPPRAESVVLPEVKILRLQTGDVVIAKLDDGARPEFEILYRAALEELRNDGPEQKPGRKSLDATVARASVSVTFCKDDGCMYAAGHDANTPTAPTFKETGVPLMVDPAPKTNLEAQHADSVQPPGVWDVMEAMQRSQEPKLLYIYERDLLALKAERDQWQQIAHQLAEALRFHEDRRINPTSRGGPALAAYDAHSDGLGGSGQ